MLDQILSLKVGTCNSGRGGRYKFNYVREPRFVSGSSFILSFRLLTIKLTLKKKDQSDNSVNFVPFKTRASSPFLL